MFVSNNKNRFYTILSTAVAFSLIATAVGLLVGQRSTGGVSPRHVFLANITLGAFFVASGIFYFLRNFFPNLLTRSKLEDHTTHAQMSYERREENRKKCYSFLYLGFAISVVGMLFELGFWLIG